MFRFSGEHAAQDRFNLTFATWLGGSLGATTSGPNMAMRFLSTMEVGLPQSGFGLAFAIWAWLAAWRYVCKGIEELEGRRRVKGSNEEKVADLDWPAELTDFTALGCRFHFLKRSLNSGKFDACR